MAKSSGSPDKAVAQTLLDTRRGQRASGAPVQPDLAEAGGRLAHLDTFYAGYRLVAITAAACEQYAAKRQGQGAANGSINRELAVLGWMLRLAFEHGTLARVPKIRKLAEASPRAGFVEDAQFGAIRRRLPEDLQAAVTIASTYGWRRDEILTLQRHQLDLEAGTLRLDVGTTKSDDGREVDVTDELHAMLAAQVARVDAPWGGSGGPRCSGSRCGISGGPGRRRVKQPVCRGCSSTTSGGRRCGAWPTGAYRSGWP